MDKMNVPEEDETFWWIELIGIVSGLVVGVGMGLLIYMIIPNSGRFIPACVAAVGLLIGYIVGNEIRSKKEIARDSRIADEEFQQIQSEALKRRNAGGH